jgi:hypothetical protein
MSCPIRLYIAYPHKHLVPAFDAYEQWAEKNPNTSPYKEDPDRFTVWSVEDQIDCGNINRIPKEPRQAALVHIGRCCHTALKSVIATKKSLCVAPPFLLDVYGGVDQAIIAVKSTGCNEAIQCCELTNITSDLSPTPLLRSEGMRGHNRTRIRPDLDTHMTSDEFHPVMRPLATWHSCTEVAQWLEAPCPPDEVKMCEVLKHPMAIAIFKSWKQFLENVGAAGARALLIYGHAFQC